MKQFSIFFTFLFVQFINACSCEEGSKSYLELYNSTDFIFVGKVLSISGTTYNNKSYKLINLKIENKIKSLKEDFITIYTPAEDSACGLNINIVNEEWIIWGTILNNIIYSDQCSNSIQLNKVDPFYYNLLKELSISKDYKVWEDKLGNKIGEGSLVDNLPNGKWIYYYNDLIISEGFYIDGKKHGEWLYYYEPIFDYINSECKEIFSKIYNSGNYKNSLKLKKVENFDEGKKEGISINYGFKGNIIKVIEYKNDVLNGKNIEYNENGYIKFIKNYTDGKLHGSYVTYHTNGIIELVANYSKNELVGEWFLFDKKGLLKCKSKKKKPKYDSVNECFICPN